MVSKLQLSQSFSRDINYRIVLIVVVSNLFMMVIIINLSNRDDCCHSKADLLITKHVCSVFSEKVLLVKFSEDLISYIFDMREKKQLVNFKAIDVSIKRHIQLIWTGIERLIICTENIAKDRP